MIESKHDKARVAGFGGIGFVAPSLAAPARRRPLRLALATTALVSILPQVSLADTLLWDGSVGNGFTSQFNWTIVGGPNDGLDALASPQPADDVVISDAVTNATRVTAGATPVVSSVLVNGTGDLTVVSTATLTATNGLTIAGGTVELAAGTIVADVTNDATLNARGTITGDLSIGTTGTTTLTGALTGVGTLTNEGILTESAGAATVTVDIYNQVGGTLSTTVNVGTSADLSGAGTIDAVGVLDGGAAATTTVSGSFTNDGSITNMSALTVSGGTFSGTGTVDTDDYAQSGGILATTVNLAGAATLSDGSIGATGVLDGAGAGTATISNSYANDGAMQGLASLTLTGGTFTGTGTTETVDYTQDAGTLSTTVTASGAIDLGGGTIGATTGVLDGAGTGLAEITGTLINNGTITDMASLELSAGTFSGSGVTQADAYVQNGGTLSTEVTVDAGGTSTLSGGTISATGVLNGQAVTVSGDTTNDGEINGTGVTITNGNELTNGGTITTGVTVNTGGTLSTTGTTSVGIVNNGTVNAQGVISGDNTNNANATFTLTGNATANDSFTNTAATSTLNVGAFTLSDVGALSNSGTISGAAGGAIGADTYVQTGASAVLGANVTVTSDSGSTLSGGSVSGTLNGAGITSNGAVTVTSTGTLGGSGLTVAATTTLTNNGTISAGTTVNGTLSLGAGSTVAAVVNNNNVTLTGAATSTGSFTNTATGDTLDTGTFALTGVQGLSNAGTISGTGSVGTTTYTQTGTGSLAATVNASGLSTLSGGTVSGTLAGAAVTVDGNVSNTGTITGTGLTLSGATLSGAGTATFTTYTQTGGSLASTVNASGASTISGGGSIAAAGTLNGGGSGTLSLGAGLANAGTVTGMASITLSGGSLSGAGTNSTVSYIQSAGSLDATVAASGVSTITGGIIGAGGVLNGTTNNLSGAIVNNGTLSGATTLASGTLTLASGSTTTGTLINNAELITAGNVDIAADVTSNGGTFNLSDGAALTMGNLTLNGESTFIMANMAQSPVEVGTLAGTGTVAFNLLGDFSSQGLGLANKEVLMTATSGMSQDKFVTGTISSGAQVRLYQADTATGELYTYLTSNPAIDGLAANLTLTEQLLSSLINRPVSPFSLVADTSSGDACRSAGYGRAVYGTATVKGDVNSGGLGNEVEGDYISAQVSGDYGCYDGRFGGWSAVLGVTAGLNQGQTEQQEFTIDGFGNNVAPLGVLNTDFSQTYAGVYVSARKAKLSVDVQLRYADAEYEFSESTPAIFAAGSDKSLSSQSLSLNTRLQYSIKLENNWNVTPSGGFSLTRVQGDTLAFDPTTTLTTGDYDSAVVFGGATVTKALPKTAGGADQAVSFGANYYHDFLGDRTSVFTANGNSKTIESPSLGGFGELSVGYTLAKNVGPMFGKDALMFFKVEGSVRAGESVPEASSVTAQVRIVF